jgi:thiaminase (transcriptional activator TenA)
MTLATDLIAAGRPHLDAQLAHPTVQGITTGQLDTRTFARWLEQDYLFLLDYVRVFTALATHAPDTHLVGLVDLAHATYHDELDLHRQLAATFAADLDHARKNPTCTAYTAFLLDAAHRSYAEGLAALLPCMWGYSTLGQLLPLPEEPRYRRWVETYRDPAFAALANRCARMLDDVAADIDPARAHELFATAMEHELAFWDVGKDV